MTTKVHKDYEALHKLSRHAKLIGSVSGLLEWDQETYMPTGAAAIRGEQLEALAGIVHKEHTSEAYKAALSKLIDIKTGKIKAKGLTEAQKASVQVWRRDFRKDTSLPLEFVEEFARLTSQSQLVWRKARKENAFNQFAPYLERIVTMSKKKAEYLGYDDHPYDALMDLYEPEAKTKEVASLFADLKKGLVPLIKKIKSKKQVDDSFINGKFDQEKQLEFGKIILKDMGFDLEKGRLDISTHPFSSSAHPTDSRITTRIHPTSLMSNISVVLHEGGHSLYEMGLPVQAYGSPLGESISLGIHESQSRWWETRIGQSKPFWKHYLPLLAKAFKGKLEKVTLDQFYKGVNKVEPSFIRVEADEVTYSLHVILRFEMEKALIEGKLKVRDIPEAWNAKMVELLGIEPKSYADGCLQDVHWSMGGFGYFPTYTLGNLYSAQFFDAFASEHKDWEKKVSKGELLFIKDWLNENIHQHGRRYSGKELLKKVTGKDFSSKPYLAYLTAKYNEIY
jgi:carboxypeptidase Taq